MKKIELIKRDDVIVDQGINWIVESVMVGHNTTCVTCVSSWGKAHVWKLNGCMMKVVESNE